MKKQLYRKHSRSLKRAFTRILIAGLGFAVTGAMTQSTYAQTTWVFNGTQAWEDVGNWTNGVPLDASNNGAATVNTSASGQTPIYSAASGTTATDFDMFVGGNGTGVMDQTGGALTIGPANNWMFVGENAGGNGTYNLSGGSLTAGALNVGAWSASGATGVFNQSGGTVTLTAGARGGSVGDASLLVGENGVNSGTYNLSGGTINSQNGAKFGLGGTASGTLNVTGGTMVNTKDLVFGQGGGIGNFDFDSGNVSTTGQLLVGNGGLGTADMSGGSLTVNDWLIVGRGGSGATSSFTQSAGAVNASTATGAVVLGWGGQSGNMNISGGTFDTSRGMTVGRGANTTGNLTISGTADVSVTGPYNGGGSNFILVADNATATGTVNLNGGTLETGNVQGGAGAATFNFGGGKLKASQDNAAFMQGLDNANVLSVSTIDNGGFDIVISQVLSGSGGLVFEGSGSTVLSGINGYTGLTDLNAGVLYVDGSIAGGIDVATGTTLGGGGSISGATVLSGGTVGPGASIGTLAVSSVSGAGQLDIEFNSSAQTIDVLNVSGVLDLTNIGVLFSDLGAGTLVNPSYVFASYGSLVGTFATEVGTPSGYTINYAFGGNNIALVSAVPEPGYFTVLIGIGLITATRRRRRS